MPGYKNRLIHTVVDVPWALGHSRLAVMVGCGRDEAGSYARYHDQARFATSDEVGAVDQC